MTKRKRHSGSNKTRKKQREYQRHVRAELQAGKVNLASGNWVAIGSSGLDNKVAYRAERIAERMRP